MGKCLLSRNGSSKREQFSPNHVPRNIIKTLFSIFTYNTSNPERIEENEILEILSKIGDQKAPGLYGIPNNGSKIALKARPQLFTRLFDQCHKDAIFPNR